MEKRFQQSSLASFRRQSLPCRRQLINRIVRAREADTNEKVRPKSRGGGETPHMKEVGMLVGNFELNP